MPTREQFDGLSPHGEHYRTHVNRLPVLVCLSLQLSGAAVGIARGAFDAFRERTAVRKEIYTGSSSAEKAGTQMRIAESKVELDTATLLLRQAVDRCDHVAETGERLDMGERAELKYHAAYVVELCRRATDRMYAASGAHAVYNDSVLQAHYRDLNTACHHAVIDIDAGSELYGRTLLGLEPNTPLI